MGLVPRPTHGRRMSQKSCRMRGSSKGSRARLSSSRTALVADFTFASWEDEIPKLLDDMKSWYDAKRSGGVLGGGSSDDEEVCAHFGSSCPAKTLPSVMDVTTTTTHYIAYQYIQTHQYIPTRTQTHECQQLDNE